MLAFFVPQEFGSEGKEAVLGFVGEVSWEGRLGVRRGWLKMWFLEVNGMRMVHLGDRRRSMGEVKSRHFHANKGTRNWRWSFCRLLSLEVQFRGET